MNYEEFKTRVMEEFPDYLEGGRKRYDFREIHVTKINERLTGITVSPKTESRSAAPTFYLEPLYERYQSCNDFEAVMERQADAIRQSFDMYPPDVAELSGETILENAVFEIISRDGNEEYLRDVPHRNFLDLAIVYRRIVRIDCNGVMSFMIDNDMCEAFDISESDLFGTAEKNTRKFFPPVFVGMRDLLFEMSGKDPEPATCPREKNVMVVTNKYHFLGATAMLYGECFKEYAKKWDCDIFILPSSIHELVILPVTNEDRVDHLIDMVREINATVVDDRDILSDSVYLYSKVTGIVSQVSDMRRA